MLMLPRRDAQGKALAGMLATAWLISKQAQESRRATDNPDMN